MNLVLDGVRFVMDAACLQAHPNTMLGRMLHSSFLEANSLRSATVANTAATATNTAVDYPNWSLQNQRPSTCVSTSSTSSIYAGVSSRRWEAEEVQEEEGPHPTEIGSISTRSAPASFYGGGGSGIYQPMGYDIPLGVGSDISANVFRVILDYYLVGKMSCPPGVSVRRLKQACEYFLIPFNHETVACSNLRELYARDILTPVFAES